MASLEAQPEVIPQPTHADSPSNAQTTPRDSADDEKRALNTGSSAAAGSILPQQNGPILPVTSRGFGSFGKSDSESTGWGLSRMKEYLKEELDYDAAAVPLAAYCFMTGFFDAVSFTACFIWCAFQTGNTIQLSLALARLFSGPGRGAGFELSDRQALVSLASFVGGAFLGGRIGDHPRLGGAKSRGWLTLATLFQAALTLAASLCALYAHERGFTSSRAEPSWTNALGFLTLAFVSASMGMQALIGTRLGSAFATTVVLTSVWVQFIADPTLFRLTKIYKQRDFRALAIFALFVGGFSGRALTGTIGPAGTLGIGAGLRVGIAVIWMVTPKAKPKPKK